MRWIFLTALSGGLISCSLYRSEGRRGFESSARQNVNLQEHKPILCDDIGSLTYWYETRFSSPHSQWIESLPHLEVWLDQIDEQQIQIRSYENHPDQTGQIPTITRCSAQFTSIKEWSQFRSFYLKSLEGEQP